MVFQGVLFTDLDGTLLDFETYRPSPEAISILQQLGRRRIAVVPVSSKTSAEVAPLMDELGLVGPSVTEGGAIISSSNGRETVNGLARGDLVPLLSMLRCKGWPVRGMSEMTAGEVGERTGLAPEAAERAMTRRASEPFVFESEITEADTDAFVAEVALMGADVVRGGRFFHLLGPGIDKRMGVRAVLAEIELADHLRTAAVGDAWNDLPMLDEVRIGYLLGDAVDPELVPPGVVMIKTVGPAGFSEVASRLIGLWE